MNMQMVSVSRHEDGITIRCHAAHLEWCEYNVKTASIMFIGAALTNTVMGIIHERADFSIIDRPARTTVLSSRSWREP